MAVKIQKVNLRSKVRWGVVGILVLLAVCTAYDMPSYFNKAIDKANAVTNLGLPKMPDNPFKLGLDLQGGAHLVYQADVSSIVEGDRSASVEGVRDVIERRVNGMGVGESVVQTNKVGNDYRIVVELPGVTDVQEAIKMIGGTPILEFKEQNTTPARELTAEEKKQLNDFNAAAQKKANEALNKIKANADFATVATEYTEDTVGKNNGGYLGYVKEMSAYYDLYTWAKTAKVGEVKKDLLKTSNGYNVVKRGAEQDGDLEVAASHILICYLGSVNCENPQYTKDQAKAKAEEIFTIVNANNFADLAKQFSADPGSKDKGGDLGTFGKGLMVKEFEDAVFKATAGQIVGPVETQFGFHIIYKKGEQKAKDIEIWRIFVSTKTEADILPPPDEWKDTGLSGKQLKRSEVVSDPTTGAVQVSLQFNDEGTKLFADITGRNVDKPVAIFLDGKPISEPRVNEPIRNGQAVISGSFDLNEAKVLSQRLNAGALPVPVELISQETVGATLGAESLNKSLYAGLIGTLVVMLFMILYYRLPGLVSVIALVLYASLILAVSKLIGVTLTLSGIAGFIMSVGMAVDANVLIFERTKEELRLGKSLKTATEEGFIRAWSSIRDSNLSTLISCVILIWFGSSFVQGFAMTLTIGVLVSMFTAIVATRTMMRFVLPWFKEKGNWLFLGHQRVAEEKNNV